LKKLAASLVTVAALKELILQGETKAMEKIDKLTKQNPHLWLAIIFWDRFRGLS